MESKMAEAERDIPDLPTLLADIEGTMVRLDNPSSQADAMSEIRNTVLPLMKDFVEAMMVFGEDVQDMVNPVEITAAQAQNISTMLTAFAQSNPGNPEIAERVKSALEDLDLGDDEDEDEEEAEEAEAN